MFGATQPPKWLFKKGEKDKIREFFKSIQDMINI